MELTSLAKPEPRGPKPPSRIKPKCECGRTRRSHRDGECDHIRRSCEDVGCDGRSGCNVCLDPRCREYRPARSSVRRSAPVARKAQPKEKSRCRHCGDTFRKHCVFPKTGTLSAGCFGCDSCPGYTAARRGSKASRRSPLTARRKLANTLWSKVVTSRPGGCECPRSEHVGPFQGAHGFGKKSYPSVRHLPINGWKLASGCHRFYTDHPIEWDDVMRADLGPEAYAELRRLALGHKPDLEETILSLRAELARLDAHSLVPSPSDAPTGDVAPHSGILEER